MSIRLSVNDPNFIEMSVSTSLKVVSLVCKCVFYRPKHNAKGGPHGIEFWSSWSERSTYPRAQRVHEKMGHLSSYHVYGH